MTFKEAQLQDTTVHRAMSLGMPLQEIIAHLATEKQAMFKKLVELEMIAPKRIKDGERIFIWRCPDHLVP